MFKVLFTLLPYLFALLALRSFVVPCLRRNTRAQAVWAMALLACAAKFTCFEAFGRDAFAPELPEKLIWAWNWLYSGMCILTGFAVLSRIAEKAVATFRRRHGAGSAGEGAAYRRVKLLALPVLSWSLAAAGIANGIKVPEPHEVELAFEALPESLDGYRILQLSDIHVSAAARRWRTEEIVAKANAADADLVVVTGDIADGMPGAQSGNAEPLKGLRAKDGVLCCTGNHEFYFDWPGWRCRYETWGLRFLMNEWTSPRPGLVVAGVTDKAGEPVEGLPNADRAFAGSPTNSFRVLLQHRPHYAPDSTPSVGQERFNLQLSGHTHGGVAPALASLVRVMNGGFVRGLYRSGDGSAVYVSTGTGQWAGFPIRFLDDPEITVFVLRRAAR